MSDDKQVLLDILGNLNEALQRTVSNAPAVQSEYAAQLLDITTQYAMTTIAETAGQYVDLVWSSDSDTVRHLSAQVTSLVESEQWQSALEQSQVVLSALPGEPGGIPMKPPKLPW